MTSAEVHQLRSCEPQTLERFSHHIEAGSVSCDLVQRRTYSLKMETDNDVVCVLFGTIDALTGYDGAKPRQMRFEERTCAFHPAGGEIDVHAKSAKKGFLAFSYPRDYADSLFGDDYRFNRSNGSVHNIANPQVSALCGLVAEMVCDYRRSGTLPLESLGGVAYVTALRGLSLVDSRRSQHGLDSIALAAVKEYVYENLCEEFKLVDLAQIADLPLATFARAFKVQTGMTPWQFVIDARLTHARHLLVDTKTPIAEIALACGLSSQQHLCRLTRKHFGISPGVMRSS